MLRAKRPRSHYFAQTKRDLNLPVLMRLTSLPYDILCNAMVNPADDEELALTLNGI